MKQQRSKEGLAVAAEAYRRAQAEELIHQYHLGMVRDYLGGGGPGDDYALTLEIPGLASKAAKSKASTLLYVTRVFLDLAHEAGVPSQIAEQTAIKIVGDVVYVKRKSKGVNQS